ncbi:MAG: hypothetical protein AAF567_13575 [Actinomycetota bacterium]
MTVAVVMIFVTCIVAGMGLTHHSGLSMRTEERFFAGWVLGIVAFTIVGLISTRLFTFGGPAVAVAGVVTLAISLTGWRRAASWQEEIDDLRTRLAAPLLSGDNPVLLLLLVVPVWILVGRMFANAYEIADDSSILVGHLASFSDWQAHLTYTASFAYADNTALNLPLAAGNDIGYHAGMNVFSALLVPAGTSLPGALQLGGAFTLFAFPGVMYCVGMRVFRSQAVSMLGTALFLFFGGLGWTELVRDINDETVDVWPRFPRTYTRLPGASEGSYWLENPIVGHFFPQRPTLIGFPLVLLVLAWLYSAWSDTEADSPRSAMRPFGFCAVVVGLTPFFNLFAFGVPLAFAGCWWLMTRLDRRWLYFLLPAAVLAYPMVRFLQPPSSSLEIPYDWVGHVSSPTGTPLDQSLADQAADWLWFWAKNFGLFLPLLAIAQFRLPRRLAIGLLPLWLFFFVPNFIKPHPWNGNNTHYFVFVILLGALPLASFIVNVVRRFPPSAFVAVPVVVSMTLAGAIDVLATNDRYSHIYPVTAMDSPGVAVGEWARTTDPDSVFVIELGWAGGYVSSHQHPVPALSGRAVVAASDGWIFDLGIADWADRKDHSRIILEAGEGYRQLIDTYDVDYLVVGANTPGWDANIAFWEEEADVVYRHAGWTVYEV